MTTDHTMTPTPRKLVVVKESVLAEAGSPAVRTVTRAAVLLVIANPMAGRFVSDL
jgi:hypothetical protein